MTIEEINARRDEIRTALEAEDIATETVEALTEEARNLTAMENKLKAEAAEAEARRQLIAEGEGKTTETHEEVKPMTLEEIRKSNAYIDAYAEYLKKVEAANEIMLKKFPKAKDMYE